MADIIPPGYAQVTVPLQHALVIRPAAVIFGVDAGGQPDPDLMAAAVQSRFQTNIAPLLDSQVTIGPVRTVVGQDGGEPTQGTTDFTGIGGRTGEMMPPNVATLVKKRTARGGRRGAGRMYLPWSASDTEVGDNGVIIGARVTAITQAFTALLTGLSADGLDMVVLHSVGQTTPGNPNLVTAMICDPLVATQRRRLGRR